MTTIATMSSSSGLVGDVEEMTVFSSDLVGEQGVRRKGRKSSNLHNCIRCGRSVYYGVSLYLYLHAGPTCEYTFFPTNLCPLLMRCLNTQSISSMALGFTTSSSSTNNPTRHADSMVS